MKTPISRPSFANKSAHRERKVYCPHGHNQIETSLDFEECAACGAIMTEAAEERYMSSLVSARHVA